MRSRLWRQNHQQALSFVRFSLGGVWYALPVHMIRLVVRPMPLVPVPHASRAVLGIVKVKGMVVPVVDLRILFGHKPSQEVQWLLLQIEDHVIGAAVDHTTGVVDILPEQLGPAPAMTENERNPSVTSVADTDDGLMFIIDDAPLFQRLAPIATASEWSQPSNAPNDDSATSGRGNA